VSIKDLGNGKYYVRVYNPHGGPEFRKTVKGDRAARKAEADAIMKFERGSVTDPGAGKVLFRDYALRVIDSRDLAPSTRLHYLRDCKRLLFPVWGDRAMRSLLHTDAEALTTAVRKSAAGAGASNALILARSIMRSAMLDGIIERNPFAGLRLGQRKPAPKAPPEWADIRSAVEQATRSDYQDATNLIIAVLAGTGVRAGEIGGIDAVADVDYLRGSLTVRRQLRWMSEKEALEAGLGSGGYFFSPPKTEAGEDRVVPLAGWVVDAIARLAGMRGEPVALPWKSPEGALTAPVDTLLPLYQPSALSTRVADASRRVGARFSPHDLRHRYATELEQRGVPLRTVQCVIGHAPVGVTMSVYVHVTPESLVLARQVVADAWADAASPTAGQALAR
jgi:integrase